jgi:DASS family divalent anion:Na+ symporter
LLPLLRRPLTHHQQQQLCARPCISQEQQQQQHRRPLPTPPAAAAAGGAALPAQPEQPQRAVAPLVGIKLGPAAAAIAFGCAVNFLLPAPAGISVQAWQLFSIFLSTILGLVLQPLPVGAWAFLGLCAVVLTKSLPFAKVSVGSVPCCTVTRWDWSRAAGL